jgi:hypothetical protein
MHGGKKRANGGGCEFHFAATDVMSLADLAWFDVSF